MSLITFVPFTVLILHNYRAGKADGFVIVLQTIAANLGSMLTPIGNPQNLYLYSLSGMSFPVPGNHASLYTAFRAAAASFPFPKAGRKGLCAEIFAETGPMRRRP